MVPLPGHEKLVSKICLGRKRPCVKEIEVPLINEKSSGALRTSITKDSRAMSSCKSMNCEMRFLIFLLRSMQISCICFGFESGRVASAPLKTSVNVIAECCIVCKIDLTLKDDEFLELHD